MSELKKTIQSDKFRYGTKIGFEIAYIYTRFLRKTTYHYRKKNKIRFFFNKFILHILSLITHYQISYLSDIGEGLYLGHIGKIVVNSNASIGSNVNINSGVIIGQENRGYRKGAPFIGNDVWLGSNSVIVGKIHIGNNVLIAPNSYVNFDIPDNSIVIGNPGKIIYNEKATESYIENRVKI